MIATISMADIGKESRKTSGEANGLLFAQV